MQHWLVSRPACLTVSSQSSTRLPGLLLDVGARSIYYRRFCQFSLATSTRAYWVQAGGYRLPGPSWCRTSVRIRSAALRCRDAVVASPHRFPVFSTSARRDVLLSAIGRLLLPALDFGIVCLLTSGLPRHLQHFVRSWKLFILAILLRHCVITASP